MPATPTAPHIGKTNIDVLRARGAAAFRAGRQRSQCPYEGGIYKRYWTEGFDAASENNPITVKLTAKERFALLQASRVASEDGSLDSIQRDLDRATRKLRG